MFVGLYWRFSRKHETLNIGSIHSIGSGSNIGSTLPVSGEETMSAFTFINKLIYFVVSVLSAHQKARKAFCQKKLSTLIILK